MLILISRYCFKCVVYINLLTYRYQGLVGIWKYRSGAQKRRLGLKYKFDNYQWIGGIVKTVEVRKRQRIKC